MNYETNIIYSYCIIPKGIWLIMPKGRRAEYKKSQIQAHIETIELEASHRNRTIIKKKIVEYGIMTPEEMGLLHPMLENEQEDSFVILITGLTEEMKILI